MLDPSVGHIQCSGAPPLPALAPYARLEYHLELSHSLPPPVPDQPEYRERRLTAAIEAFEALCPGDAFEARLAVQVILCGAHAVESLREANLYPEDFSGMTRCRAQAAGMMREERAARRMLAQVQKQRLAAEAVAAAAPAQPAAAPPPHDKPRAPLRLVWPVAAATA